MDIVRARRKKTLSSWEGVIRRRKTSAKLTICAASKLLGKKLSSSGDLMNPSKLWMQTVPTEDCDIVLTFPTNTDDQTLTSVLNHLKSCYPEIAVCVRQHTISGIYGFYVTASYENLLKGAEEVRVRKKLKPDYGGGLKEFSFEERMFFQGIDDAKAFLTSQERQNIVLHLVNSVCATDGLELNHIKFVAGQALVPKCISEGIISQVLPLHKDDKLQELKETWVQAFFKFQPLDSICDYFGVKIAIYFAWLGHYTWALIIPALFGLIIWIFCIGKDQTVEDVCFVVFAFFNVVWATLYMESWKRYCSELAFRWGTLDTHDELLALPRPLFRGELATSSVTGRLEPTYPIWKRNVFRYCVSLPVILLCLAVVFFIMFVSFEFQEWWDIIISEQKYPFWLTYIPKICLGLVINILDTLYKRIAFWLNDQENYRLEEAYENHLIIKILVFQFVNSFLSLFYIAFYLQDMEKLKEQLAALLITRQVIGNIRESCIPFILEQLKLAKMCFETVGSPTDDAKTSNKEMKSNIQDSQKPQSDEIKNNPQEEEKSDERILSQAEVESSLYKYDGTFEDYLEMFIQFGYVILFSSAFPMAAVWALLNNIIEIRSDAFKLCCIFQRPFGQRAENIGSWQDAMEIMCIIGVAVNCALIGLSGQVQRMFPELSTTGTIILIVVLEHALLSLKYIISCAIPDTPEWVATEMAKIEFNRREAAKKLVRTHSGSNFILKPSAALIRSKLQSAASMTDVACQVEMVSFSPISLSKSHEFKEMERKTEEINEFNLKEEEMKFFDKELFPELNFEPNFDKQLMKDKDEATASSELESSSSSAMQVSINSSCIGPDPCSSSPTELFNFHTQPICEEEFNDVDLTSEESTALLKEDNSDRESSPVTSKFQRLSAATSKLKAIRRFSLGSATSKNIKKLPFSFTSLPGVTKTLNRLSSANTSKKDNTNEQEKERELLNNANYTDS